MKHGRLIDADALKELLQAWKCVAQERGAEINNMFASAIIAQVDAMPTIEPEQKVEGLLPDGTLHLFTDTDLSKVSRVLVSQNGTHYGDLFYADGDRKTGKWICIDCTDMEGNGVNSWKCSGCGEIYADFTNFCPNCGADLRGEQE